MIQYNVAENEQRKHCLYVFNDDHAALQLCIARNASLELELLIARTSVQLSITVLLQGEGACAAISAVCITEKTENVHIEVIQHHQVSNTKSSLMIRGIIKDSAQLSYRGTIRIEQHARNCSARQENKNILLSPHARVLSAPNLEILNNDVHCFHGSAISRCDEKQLWYMAARGLEKKKAQQLLVNAFIADMFADKKMQENTHDHVAELLTEI